MGNNNEKIGQNSSLKISEEVISSIAANAALEIDGVAGLSNKVADVKGALKGKNFMKAVKVIKLDNEIVIDIYISLAEGAKIQTVVPTVQKAVKNEVQNMTGKVVGSVNVNVADLAVSEDEENTEE